MNRSDRLEHTAVGALTTPETRKVPKRFWTERRFGLLCGIALAIPLLMLAILFGAVLLQGLPRLHLDFLTSYPSRFPERAGILPALVGTAYLMLLTAAMAIPVGVGAAIYLEEFARASRLTSFIELNIANLAGVPSIIYGLLGLEIFVRVVGMGRSLLAGAATLALLLLPMVVIVSREALRTVPRTYREGALALGATRWQSVYGVVLPTCAPGILTGLILALARAIGETAPLITIGALTYVPFMPTDVMSPFTVLPIQIFNWVSRPQAAFAENAAAGIVVLLAVMVVLNGTAIYLRMRLQHEESRN